MAGDSVVITHLSGFLVCRGDRQNCVDSAANTIFIIYCDSRHGMSVSAWLLQVCTAHAREYTSTRAFEKLSGHWLKRIVRYLISLDTSVRWHTAYTTKAFASLVNTCVLPEIYIHPVPVLSLQCWWCSTWYE